MSKNKHQRRRIQAASFTTKDISSQHLVALLLAALLMLTSIAAFWAGATKARAAATSKPAAWALNDLAERASYGVRNYQGGGSSQLLVVQSMGGLVDASMQEMGQGVGVLRPVVGDLSAAADGARSSWDSLMSAMQQISVGLAASRDMAKSLGAAAPAMARFVKELEQSGRAADSRQYFDAAMRLYAVAEAGVSPASVARVDYDLRLLAAAAKAEPRESLAWLMDVAGAQKAAMSAQPTREQLAVVLTAAEAAKVSAQGLLAAATSAASLPWFVAASFLALGGFAVFWVSLAQVLSDMSRRFHRATQQFRANEQGRDELLVGIEDVLQGQQNRIGDVDSESDLGEVVEGFNSILESRARAAAAQASSIEQLQKKAGAAAEASAAGRQLAAQLREESLAMGNELLAARAMSDSGAADLDSAAFASREASAQAAGAARLAQDAESRIDGLREGLQETSKGIKRLGERTQEIGAVFEELELLTEQVSVLGLNANLEAERAGDAGNGFRLVAREVQALARRASEVLERFSGLIQVAQADARAASEAADRSTAQVLQGASVSIASQALLAALQPLTLESDAISRESAKVCRDTASRLTASVMRLNDLSAQLDAIESSAANVDGLIAGAAGLAANAAQDLRRLELA